MHTFAYGNLVDDATLSGGSWEVAHPLSELQERELAVYAKSSTSSSADTTIILDHGSAKAAQCFALIAHNIVDPAATITINRGTTSGGGEVYSGSAVDCWPFAPINDDYDGAVFPIIVVTPAATTARYTQITISTSAVVRIGRLFVGPVFATEIGITKRTDDWLPDLSTVDRTESGADWVVARPRLRHSVIEYGALSRAEASLMAEVQRTHGVTGEVMFLPDTTSPAETQQFGFLAMFRQLSALESPFWNHNSIAIGFDERGGAP